MRIHATCLDHVVLNVSDLDASRRWWSTLTGARATRDHEGEVSFVVGGQAIRLREGVPAPRGSISVCLLADASIHDLYERAEELHAVQGEIHPRTAATAPVQALTLEDPDGYQVELATYTPEGAPVP
ncbi:VOC family protein [Kribbella shirazensis]|uniref:Catechol 2,3-dioxygenase-like lactoylglutathione lyase family enzyme n=1 Tax=Kribbella shirazensis TaxID=1105143 RepID=A0A7X5VEY2_9ACTN|nr:VOC family protein [Kribbella shirazensis]NIK59078.1 catechol 2,3-dioxygenase-like lactoylglutathione lyase family enzyme [Kribbella shirazensis]